MSNTRNGLLAQIVTASGGTVRNKDNRNMLLEDWCLAVGGGCRGNSWQDLNGVILCVNTVNCSEVVIC